MRKQNATLLLCLSVALLLRVSCAPAEDTAQVDVAITAADALIILIGIVGIAVTSRVLRERKRLQAIARTETRAAAKTAADSLGDLDILIGSIETEAGRIRTVYGEASVASAVEELRHLQRRLDAAKRAHHELRRAPRHDPDTPGLSVAELEVLTALYEEDAAVKEELQDELTNLETRLRQIEQAAEAARTSVAALEKVIAQAEAAIEEAESAGLNVVGPEDDLGTARSLQNQAQAAFVDRRYSDAVHASVAARRRANTAFDAATLMLKRRSPSGGSPRPPKR